MAVVRSTHIPGRLGSMVMLMFFVSSTPLKLALTGSKLSTTSSVTRRDVATPTEAHVSLLGNTETTI